MINSMRIRKGIIVSQNLQCLSKGEEVIVIPKNSKILGVTIKKLYGMTAEDIAVRKINRESKNDRIKEIELFIINKNDIKFIQKEE